MPGMGYYRVRISEATSDCGKNVSALLISLLIGVAPALAQSSDVGEITKASDWKFILQPGSPTNLKHLCLVFGDRKFPFFEDSYSYNIRESEPYEQCNAAHLWVSFYNHSIYVDTNLLGIRPKSIASVASAAEDAGIFTMLNKLIEEENERKAEREKREHQEYLDAYKAANTINDIDDFESKYASSDPDGFIPLLQAKKKDLAYKKYKESFENAKTSDDFTSFVVAYGNDDPDGLVPLAKNKLQAIRLEDEQKKKNEEENEARLKAEKEAVAEKQIQEAIRKHSEEIKSLGFPAAFLKASIYLQVDFVNRPMKFITFEAWLAGLFETGNYSNITRIKLKNSQGVLLKRSGMRSAGILFKMDGGDLFPSHISNSEKATPLESAGDQVAASMLIIDALKPNK